uniref:Uncharacterized protein n=1 Tax=Arundo donax TaxID=35708 RepID=A0A0A9C1I8_ARUDO
MITPIMVCSLICFSTPINCKARLDSSNRIYTFRLYQDLLRRIFQLDFIQNVVL